MLEFGSSSENWKSCVKKKLIHKSAYSLRCAAAAPPPPPLLTV